MFYTYVLECVDTKQGNKEFYTGFSREVPTKRELDHKYKRVNSTKQFDRITLVYFEACLDKKDAMKRELQLKTGFGRGYIKRRIENYLKNLRP